MLIVEVRVNTETIDTIFIHNTGNRNGDIYEYEIVDPSTNKRLIEKTIWHKRSWGYRPLLESALKMLEEHSIEERIPKKRGKTRGEILDEFLEQADRHGW